MSGPTRRDVMLGGAAAIAGSALPDAAASALEVPAGGPIINPWRDYLGNLRTDRPSGPGWGWNERSGCWVHSKLSDGGMDNWIRYITANPDRPGLPPEAWKQWDAMRKRFNDLVMRRHEPFKSEEQAKWDANAKFRLESELRRQADERRKLHALQGHLHGPGQGGS